MIVCMYLIDVLYIILLIKLVLAVCCSGACRCVLPMPRWEDMSNDGGKKRIVIAH